MSQPSYNATSIEVYNDGTASEPAQNPSHPPKPIRVVDGNPSRPTDAAFVHPQAIIGTKVSLGQGTRVWAFAHIVSPATIGEDCNICDHTFIEGDVRIGDRVTIKCGVFLWDGLIVENDVFIGPAAVFTNDPRPRSKKYPQKYPPLVLKEGCTIGANSTTLPGLTIGRWAMVGAGAVVTHNVPDFALVMGNPARFRGWVCRCGEKLSEEASTKYFRCDCGLTYEQVAENELKETTGHTSAQLVTSNGNHISTSKPSSASPHLNGH